MSIQYSYRPELGKVRDFFSLLNMLTRFKKLEDVKIEIDLPVSPVVAETYNGISERARRILPDIELLCSSGPQGASFLSDFLADDAKDSTEISDMIASIKKRPVSEMISKLLAFYDESNNYSEYFYSLLVGNHEMFLEYLNSLPLSAEMKWYIINLTASPAHVMGRFYKALNILSSEFENAYTVNADFIAGFREEIKRKFETDPASILSGKALKYDSLIEEHKIDTVNFSVLFFPPTAINFFIYRHRLDILLGYDYEKGIDLANVMRADPISMFKAFTDKSRLSIMQLLMEQDCCASDISKQLSIPMSSLVYHLSTLEAAGAICRQLRGKKAIYKFNKDLAEQAKDYITSFVK